MPFPGTPLSSCAPRSSNSNPDPITRSRSLLDTSTSFGPARALTRAPMCTAIPPMSSPRTSHSPVCNPTRTSIPNACTASRIAIAQRGNVGLATRSGKWFGSVPGNVLARAKRTADVLIVHTTD